MIFSLSKKWYLVGMSIMDMQFLQRLITSEKNIKKFDCKDGKNM